MQTLEMKPMMQFLSEERGHEIFIPANPEMLAIARLYLEKYELIAEPDRELYRAAIKTFMEGRVGCRITGQISQ